MRVLGDWLTTLFPTDGLAPHGFCLAWEPGLLWLHVFSDALTGLAYYSIPVVLIVLTWKRRDLGFGWVAALFAAFILACGSTHLLAVWTLWNPDYYVQGVVKAMTAAVSMATAVVLWPLLPRALATPTPEQMALVNGALQKEIEEKEVVASQLRDSEQRYASFFENVGEALFTFIVDSEGRFRVEMLNRKAAEGLAVEQAGLRGRSLREIFPDAVAVVLEERFRAACADGLVQEFEQVVPGADGSATWHTIVVPLDDGAGRPLKLLVTARDITARKQLEDEVLQTSKLATVGTMSAGIAHEMSQPLNAISLWATVARRKLGTPETSQVEQALTVIEEQALRMRKIIDHMRAFSRRDDGDIEAFDAAEAASQAVALMGREFNAADIALTVDLPSGDVLPVSGRPIQFEQVIVNLLANARDAVAARAAAAQQGSEPPRRVTVSGERRGETVVLTVQDSGGGIPPDVLGRLFEPFFTTKPLGRGTGLGLAICDRIIQSMGGRITAETVEAGTLDAGARFSIEVPLRRDRRAGNGEGGTSESADL